MKFEQFAFDPIRHLPRVRHLPGSDWIAFHGNTEFQARAALYHLERLTEVYERYLSVQPEPDAQNVWGLEHPVKEAAFFEYIATVSRLTSCLDSALQEINCAYSLGLAPVATPGEQHVTMKNVTKRVKAKFDSHRLLDSLRILYEKSGDRNSWFGFLRAVRNTGTHADIYTRSSETRDVSKILASLDRLSRTATRPLSRDEIQSTLKREVAVYVDGETYYMLGTANWLVEEMLGSIRQIHDIMISDPRAR